MQHYFGIVRRRHLQFLIPLLAGWLLVWGASWILPSRYNSSMAILVEQPTMPRDYVTPNVNDDLQNRMQSLTQQILSRSRLLHIIDQLRLYPDPHGRLTADDKVEKMRKDIEIDMVRDGMGRINAFNVSYQAHDPHLAQQVTSELTNLFINENLEARQQQSEDTTKFLGDQLEDARKALADQEEKIREFKGQHVGEMPGQLQSNLQILSGLQAQLQSEQDALNSAKQQHVYLQSLADQYRALQGSLKSADGTGSVGLPAIDAELERLRAQLADLSSRYTERHPDVRKLKEQIAKTEKMRAQLLASGKDKSTPTEATDDLAATDPNRASMLAQVQSQLRSNQVEIVNREQSITTLTAKIADYQSRLNTEPVREQQLADLTRGYDQSKANYDDLLKRKNESSMATDMEKLQQGERFSIIDPPSLPTKPDFPNRLKFCGMGLAVGLALGVGVAGASEFIDDRIYDEKALQRMLPVAVISEIPAIAVASEQQRERRRFWLGWATAAVVTVTILLGSAFSFLRG
ncbi:MAG TPA: XrtA system polysaccharide chain length determinant [Acidobacteriaceae bacterium]|nr:XrtA system polysaccharide chain length determinant [Acidobacteriaceae bacterium]